MIQNLLVLDSQYIGCRDLFWVESTIKDLLGYNVYRAIDYPTNWVKLNSEPHPGHFYRDQTQLTWEEYTVTSSDWVTIGVDGQWVFKIPGAPIWASEIVKGAPMVANNPMDVEVTIDTAPVGVGRVDGQEGLVFFEALNLGAHGAVTSKKGHPFTKNQVPTQTVKVRYRKLRNLVNIFLAGAGSRTFYTVVPVLSNGQEYHAPGVSGTEIKNTLEVDQMDFMLAEMVRRNAFLFEQSGEPASLLIRRTRGVPCGCLISNGEPRSGCPSCYETGVVGGYYGPFELLFIDPDVAATRTINEGGVKVERSSRSYLGPTPVVQNGDLIIRRNGERLEISDVVYKSPRGVLVQQDFNVILLPAKDTRYLVPLVAPQPPGIPPETFDPRFVETRTLPSEPLADPRTDPTKTWENPKKPVGRTTKFGNIQT
jgi:hypothetical protein